MSFCLYFADAAALVFPSDHVPSFAAPPVPALHALLQRFAAGACCVLALVLTGDARSAENPNSNESMPVRLCYS